MADPSSKWPAGPRSRAGTRSLRLDREPEVTRAFLELLEPGTLVVDGGAHWGLYSLMAGLAGCQVVAFEPSAQNRDQLLTNLGRSGLSESVDVRPEALWSDAGRLEFKDYEGPSWGLSMMAGAASQPDDASRFVPAVALDDLKLSPRIIKLDIEGAEAAALRGALHTLRHAAPTVLVEIHGARLERLGESAEMLQSMLTSAGYKVHELASPSAADTESVTHWVCRPRSR